MTASSRRSFFRLYLKLEVKAENELESVFKLSLIMNMIDNLSGPMAGVASKVGANVSKLDASKPDLRQHGKGGRGDAGDGLTDRKRCARPGRGDL